MSAVTGVVLKAVVVKCHMLVMDVERLWRWGPNNSTKQAEEDISGSVFLFYFLTVIQTK